MSTTPTVAAFPNGWQQATRYPDPAIVALDPRFEKYWLTLSCVERIATGCRWAEGPVYFGDGHKYRIVLIDPKVLRRGKVEPRDVLGYVSAYHDASAKYATTSPAVQRARPIGKYPRRSFEDYSRHTRPIAAAARKPFYDTNLAQFATG